ncbi:hypothetical protein PG989_005606 [Apiospora arundinis]
MAPVTLQMLSDAKGNIDLREKAIMDSRRDYEGNHNANIRWYNDNKEPLPAEKAAAAEGLLKSIKDSEDTLKRLKEDLKVKTRQYYVNEHMSKGLKAEYIKQEDTEHDGYMPLAPGVKRKLPDNPHDLVKFAKRADRGFILVNEGGTWSIPDLDKDFKKHIRASPSVPADGRGALDSIANLLVNQEGSSITHRPKQMGRILVSTPHDKQHLLDIVITCVRDLQDDTAVLVRTVVAILDGTMSSDTIPDLVASLESTFGPNELQQVYGTEAGNSMSKVLEQIGDEDHVVQTTMIMRLLHSAIVLQKYACLATALAAAVAPKFGRGKDDDRRDPIVDSAIGVCINLYCELLEVYTAEISGEAQPPNMPRLTIDYNPNNEVSGNLEIHAIKGPFAKLSKLKGVNCNLVEFLGSVGYGKN